MRRSKEEEEEDERRCLQAVGVPFGRLPDHLVRRHPTLII